MDKDHDKAISMTMEEGEYSEYSSDDDDDMDESDDNNEEVESDEEVIRDRVEVDRGYTYMVEDGLTVTRPKVAVKTYFKRRRCYPLQHQLYSYEFPLSTFAKFALHRYNHIEGTKYEYVGLVKAYSRALAGFRFWIRLKACLPGQEHAINFQAILTRGLPDRITDVVFVNVEFVYPLPTPVMPVNLLAQHVSAALLS
ncbi:uncharacterized protein LOC141706777 [Apium graveolens]|uniref:uncharacterized protein LOC141706777 n=1 Tax=Apium graveolens TaxID=4045 RepID=UPI003D7A9097